MVDLAAATEVLPSKKGSRLDSTLNKKPGGASIALFLAALAGGLCFIALHVARDIARIVAVCDLDSKRVQHAKEFVEGTYAKKAGSANAVAVKTFGDYRELLKDGHVDAIAVSTPDHWHCEPVIAAALAGKDIYVQKPLSMTLAEGRAVSDIVRAKKRAFQIGSQQRSTSQFRIACELVRNGRLGKLHTVQIGLPVDPSGGNAKEMDVPANLNYEMWLGCTPKVPYTEDRVHSQIG